MFAVLGSALSAQEVAHLAASVPQTFEPLVAEAQNRFADLMPADQLWSRVSQRLGVDHATARRVTEAVLETLAERIAAGQVEDLIAQLDPVSRSMANPIRASVISGGASETVAMPERRCQAIDRGVIWPIFAASWALIFTGEAVGSAPPRSLPVAVDRARLPPD